MAGYDMLVRLYDLPDDTELKAQLLADGITIRRVMAPDIHSVYQFAKENFSEGWADACQACAAHHDCSVAVKDHKIIGFACNEASTLDYFGPTGVLPEMRGKGVGKALLLHALHALREKGYNYAIIGWVGPAAFYQKCVGAVPLEGSIPGAYQNLLKV